MILAVAGMLTLAGFLTWGIGAFFEYPEVAVIGGTILVATGAMVITGGIQVAQGESVETETVETTVPVEDIGEASHVATKDVSSEDSSPTGIDFDDVGSTMYISGAGTASIYSYDSGDHDLALATLRNSYDVSSEDSTPVGIEFQPDGSRMFVVGDATTTIYQYDLGTAFNITTATVAGNLSVGGHIAAPRAMDFNEDGTVLYVVGSDTGVIHSYSLSTPYDVETASHLDDFDVSSQEGTPTAMDFSLDGKRMLMAGEDSVSIFEYELGTAYDLTTASFTGNVLDVSAQVNQPSGLAYEDDGLKTFATDRNQASLEQYDTSMTESSTQTSKQTVYTDVEFPTQFPAGLLLMLVGGVLVVRPMGEEGGIM